MKNYPSYKTYNYREDTNTNQNNPPTSPLPQIPDIEDPKIIRRYKLDGTEKEIETNLRYKITFSAMGGKTEKLSFQLLLATILIDTEKIAKSFIKELLVETPIFELTAESGNIKTFKTLLFYAQQKECTKELLIRNADAAEDLATDDEIINIIFDMTVCFVCDTQTPLISTDEDDASTVADSMLSVDSE